MQYRLSPVTKVIIDTNGSPVVIYQYTAYGTSTVLQDTAGLANINPFRFKGYYFDSESGMYYCQTRYYVPEWCRWLNADSPSFLQPDSLQGLNLYTYCGNNPIRCVDSNGTDWNSFWNDVGSFFKNTFSGYGKISYETITYIEDYLFFGFEEGIISELIIGDDTKPVSFFYSKPVNKWYFWEYQVGVKINIDNFKFSTAIGLGKMDMSIGSDDFTFDISGGWEKVSFGFSKTVNGNTYYERIYLSPFKILCLVFALIGIPIPNTSQQYVPAVVF